MCLGRGASGSLVSSVTLCFPAAQRNEYLPQGGRALSVRSGSWKTCSRTLTCSCVQQQDGPVCYEEKCNWCYILTILYTTWVYCLAAQRLLLRTEQGSFVRFAFLQVKAFPFIRNCMAPVVGWPTLPTCLPPLMLSPTMGNSERGLNLCAHGAGRPCRKEHRSAEYEQLLLWHSARSLPCQCCRSDRLLQRLQSFLILSSGKDADCGKFSSSLHSKPTLFSLWSRCHPFFFIRFVIQGTIKRIFYKEYVTID